MQIVKHDKDSLNAICASIAASNHPRREMNKHDAKYRHFIHKDKVVRVRHDLWHPSLEYYQKLQRFWAQGLSVYRICQIENISRKYYDIRVAACEEKFGEKGMKQCLVYTQIREMREACRSWKYISKITGDDPKELAEWYELQVIKFDNPDDKEFGTDREIV